MYCTFFNTITTAFLLASPTNAEIAKIETSFLALNSFKINALIYDSYST